MSHTQSAPSSSVSASLALPQNLLAASHQYVPTLESNSGSSFQPQGTTSQYAPILSLGAKVPVSSQYYPATLSGSSQSLSQSSQKWQPSTSGTKVFQPSSTAVLQGFQTSGASQSISQYPSRFGSLSSVSADGSSLQLQGTSSQYAPASLDAKVPVYSQAAPSGFSLPMSQPSQWQPSTSRWSQGFQASGTVASQISSPSQGSKSPRRFSTLTSAASPGQSFSNVYTSSSLSRAGAQLAGSSRDVPMQTGSYSADGSSLQLQGTSSQYAPASLVSKVPPYKPAAPSGSLSLSQPSQWQPSTSTWSQGFQASGTVESQGFQTSGTATSQSSSPSQGSKSTLTSASPGNLFSTQDGSGRYSGLFSQSQSASSQYVPAPLDAEVPVYSQAAPSGFSLPTSQPSQWQPSTSRWSQGFQASGTVASQSSSPSQGSKFPSRFSTLTSAASPDQSFSTQDGSGRYSGLSSQSQSASVQYNPGSPAYVKRGFSLLDSSRQSTGDQSSSPQFSSGSSSMAALSLPVDSVAHSSQSSSSNSWRTSSLSGEGLRPSMVSSKAASGSIRRQMSPGWSSHDVLPRQKWHDHKIASPWGAQSSVMEAPVTGSIPFEEVASNVLAGKSLNSRSRFSLSRQYVEGGLSSSHASMSHTQSAPSSSVSASLALPQNLLAASHQYVPTLESSSGSSSQPQGTTSQYAPILSLGAKVPVSSQYYPATLSGSSQSLSQSSQKWQPSTSGTKVFQPSSTAVLQGFQTSGAWQSISQYPSRFGSLSSASADGSSLQLQGTSSQYAPASLNAEVPVYSQAAPSGFSLPTSHPSQWQPSTSRWSQGFQASGTATSQSSSPTQGSKSTSRLPTLTSAASPGNLFSTQDGSDRYSGLFSQSQSASSQYTPTALDAKVPVYSQAAPSGFSLPMSQPSQWQPSTSRWSQGFQASGTVASQISSPSQGSKSPRRFSTLTSAASPGQSFSNVYTSSSLSRAGAQLAGSSRDVPMQTGSYSADGSSLQLQGTSSQYAPASLVSKVPPYKPAAPSGSLSLSQPSQWQPSTSTWSQGFQASGTVASQGFQTSGTATSQSSSPTQGSKFPSRFSTLTSAASPDQSFSTQDGSGRYSGLSSQSQSASVQYNPGSPAYVKRGFSLLDSSRQSTGDQSSSPQFSSGSSSMAALSLPVDSVAHSSQSSSSNSWRTSSLSGEGLRPSMVSSKAASGSIHRRMSPGLFGSVQHRTDSTTYGQKPSWRDFSSVKG
ncbi:unnamed protein product [Leuciscus chuanchicus]